LFFTFIRLTIEGKPETDKIMTAHNPMPRNVFSRKRIRKMCKSAPYHLWSISLIWPLIISLGTLPAVQEEQIIEAYQQAESLSLEPVQFALPGAFVAPFANLNSIPQAGLDVDNDGSTDIIQPCSCRSMFPIPNGINANAGFFDDQLIVATGVSGQTWVVNTGESFYHRFKFTDFPRNGFAGNWNHRCLCIAGCASGCRRICRDC